MLNLKGQSICITSYSKSMEKSGLGKKIDSYDQVVRINNGVNILNTKDLGSKCDIFACSFLGGKIKFIENCYEDINDLIDNDVRKEKVKSIHSKYKIKNDYWEYLVPKVNHELSKIKGEKGDKTMKQIKKEKEKPPKKDLVKNIIKKELIKKLYNQYNGTVDKSILKKKLRNTISICDILLEKQVKNILIFTNNKENYDEDELNCYSKYYKIIVQNPNNPIIYYMVTTGLCTIITILQAKPKNLFICGFDFTMYLYNGYDDLYKKYRGGYTDRLNKTYEEYQDDYHSTIFEKYVLKKLWKKYNFEIDEKMINMLNEIKEDELDGKIFKKVLKENMFQDSYLNYYNDIIKIIG